MLYLVCNLWVALKDPPPGRMNPLYFGHSVWEGQREGQHDSQISDIECAQYWDNAKLTHDDNCFRIQPSTAGTVCWKSWQRVNDRQVAALHACNVLLHQGSVTQTPTLTTQHVFMIIRLCFSTEHIFYLTFILHYVNQSCVYTTTNKNI